MNLSKNFSLEELTHTSRNAVNLPGIKEKEALKLLAEKVLNPLERSWAGLSV